MAQFPHLYGIRSKDVGSTVNLYMSCVGIPFSNQTMLGVTTLVANHSGHSRALASMQRWMSNALPRHFPQAPKGFQTQLTGQ